ncbi:MAG: hypothetical protein Q3976_02595 [Corynebacterium sp.]|nr:hypothetical protein [Corynebacterium sp.]
MSFVLLAISFFIKDLGHSAPDGIRRKGIPDVETIKRYRQNHPGSSILEAIDDLSSLSAGDPSESILDINQRGFEKEDPK